MARNTKHGLSGTVEYRILHGMKSRCYDPKHRSYAAYGGRRIRICQRWRDDAANFLRDMGPRPSPRHSVDRIDGNGNYEPGNCRWATPQQQNANKKSLSKLLTIDGETKLVVQWSKVYGVQAQTIYWRLKHGWPSLDAISVPTQLTPSAPRGEA